MASIFAYSTQKVLVIKSKRLFFLFILYMIICGSVVAGFMVYFGKDYAYSDRLESAVTLKVFGVVKTDFSAEQFKKGPNTSSEEIALYNRIWGPSDYIVPHIESTEVFIATNLIITENQNMSTCAEDPEVPNAVCHVFDRDTLLSDNCQVGVLGGLAANDSNGVPTGRCMNTEFENGTETFTCEIESWCPVLRQSSLPLANDEPVLRKVSEVEVVISNSVHFPVFKYHPVRTPAFRNFMTCDREGNQCPRFRLGTIVERAFGTQTGSKSLEDVYKYGTVLAIRVHWNDCVVDEECDPTYEPERLHNPEESTYLHGENFRYLELEHRGVGSRTLIKAYGIRIVVLVSGVAKQWDFLTFLLNWLTYGTALVVASGLFSSLVVNCTRRVVVVDDNSSPEEINPCRDEIGKLECRPFWSVIPSCWRLILHRCKQSPASHQNPMDTSAVPTTQTN